MKRDQSSLMKTSIFFVLFFILTNPCLGENPEKLIEQNLSDLIQVYQEFHRFPEVSFQEAKTADRLAKIIKAADFEVTQNVGGPRSGLAC